MKIKSSANPFFISSTLKTLEEQVSLEPLTERKYQQLHRRLDEAFEGLSFLKTQSLVLPKLEEAAVNLYGKLANGRVDGEISHIKRSIHTTLSKNAISRLKKRIERLRENHRLLSKDRKTLQEAEAVLEGQHPSCKGTDLPPLNEDPLESCDLLEIAKTLYDGKIVEARKQFLCLSHAQQERFAIHLRRIEPGATAFYSLYPTLRALVAVANDVADNGTTTYPSNQEVDLLLSEACVQ